MLEEIKNLKKVELHLHLDGSVMLDRADVLSNLNKNKLRSIMVAPSKCRNLSDYLKRFEFNARKK